MKAGRIRTEKASQYVLPSLARCWLSQADEEEVDERGWSDEDEAFVVKDGYFSEDEGLDGEMDLDEACSNGSNTLPESQPLAAAEAMDLAAVSLRVKRAFKFGQAIAFSSLKISMPPRRDWIKGDPAMLTCLRGVRITDTKLSLKRKKKKKKR